jgi:hypothetical protein
MSRVYWDSMLFIYWLEDHPQYAKQVDAIHSRMKQRQDRLITGAFTFGEVLAGTYRKGRADLRPSEPKPGSPGAPELADQFRALSPSKRQNITRAFAARSVPLPQTQFIWRVRPRRAPTSF